MTTLPRRSYEGLPTDARAIIDEAFDDMATNLRNAGFKTMNTDQAEVLIDAMTAFVLASNPSLVNSVRAAAVFYEATGTYVKGCGPA